MSPLRLVLVTRRFWPLMGRAARATANLAAELVSRKIDVTVLTVRWHPLWPAEVTCGGVPVVRLAGPPGRGRSTTRYVRALARWLEQNQDRYDLVYVSMLKHEAYAARRATRKGAPVVLRAEAAGRFGDCVWQLEAKRGRRIKQACMKADALIGPSRLIEQELIRSDDSGATWQEPQPVTERNEINGHLIRLKDGRLLLAYGVRVNGRRGVCAKMSGDDGRTWADPLRLAHTVDGGDRGYPSSVQLPGGQS